MVTISHVNLAQIIITLKNLFYGKTLHSSIKLLTIISIGCCWCCCYSMNIYYRYNYHISKALWHKHRAVDFKNNFLKNSFVATKSAERRERKKSIWNHKISSPAVVFYLLNLPCLVFVQSVSQWQLSVISKIK